MWSTAPSSKSLKHTKWCHRQITRGQPSGVSPERSLGVLVLSETDLYLLSLALSCWWIICFSKSWTYHRNLLSNCYIRSHFLGVWTSKCATESSLKFPQTASPCLEIPSLSKKKGLVLFNMSANILFFYIFWFLVFKILNERGGVSTQFYTPEVSMCEDLLSTNS